MNKKLILIAEDEKDYAVLLKTMLEKESYEVEIALNGDELLKLARAKKPALIILDLIMPMKNGFQVLSEMKKDEQLKYIKVIVLSNVGQEEDIREVKRLGADDFLIKSDEIFYDVMNKIKKQLN